MKLLVITNAGTFPSPEAPHAGIFFMNLLMRLRDSVERIVVVCPQAYFPGFLATWVNRPGMRPRRTRGCWQGIEVHRPFYFPPVNAPYVWLGARRFRQAALDLCIRLHRRHRFDLVVGYQLTEPGLAAASVASALDRPCVSWAIGSDVHTVPRLSEGNRRMLVRIVRRHDLVLAESDALRRALLRAAPGSRHIHTFYKGIDLAGLKGDDADKPALRRELGLEADRSYLLCAGNASRAKGIYDFYAAYKRLRETFRALGAIWVGDGPEAAALRARSRAEAVGDGFCITGMQPRPTVLRYMEAADVMLFASHAEGLPNAVMEAMAAGLPTVATDVGGIREVVRHGVTGLLVPARDVEAMTAAVRALLERPDEASALASRASDFIHRYFDVDLNAPVAARILERAARRAPPEAPLPPCAGVEPGRLPMDRFTAEEGGPNGEAR